MKNGTKYTIIRRTNACVCECFFVVTERDFLRLSGGAFRTSAKDETGRDDVSSLVDRSSPVRRRRSRARGAVVERARARRCAPSENGRKDPFVHVPVNNARRVTPFSVRYRRLFFVSMNIKKKKIKTTRREENVRNVNAVEMALCEIMRNYVRTHALANGRTEETRRRRGSARMGTGRARTACGRTTGVGAVETKLNNNTTFRSFRE